MRWLAAAIVAALAITGCRGGSGADEESFCPRYDALVDDDPFTGLDVAGFDEMREAFAELGRGAASIADAAPEPARPAATTYDRSVRRLTELLDGAGYDPRRLDTAAYADAAADYTDAAAALDRAARPLCE